METKSIILNQQILDRFLKPTMLLTFLGILIIFGIISAILNYHWVEYGFDAQRLKKVRHIYFGVSALLLLTITSLLLSSLNI